MKKYSYSYEKVEMGSGGWSPLGGFGLSAERYREVIDRRAGQGWRFVSAVPLETRANGMIESIELVFEMETEEA